MAKKLNVVFVLVRVVCADYLLIAGDRALPQAREKFEHKHFVARFSIDNVVE